MVDQPSLKKRQILTARISALNLDLVSLRLLNKSKTLSRFVLIFITAEGAH